MSNPHPHKDLIIAWANGSKIEYCADNLHWYPCTDIAPNWYKDTKYRIKPEEKKPVKRWQWTYTTQKGGYNFAGMYFFTEQEAKNHYSDTVSYKKIPGTEMEFEE